MPTATYQPVVRANWTPGHPAVYFDGSDFLQMPATTLAGMTEGEAYIVMQSDIAAAQTGLWTVGSGSHYTHYPWSNGWVYESFGLQGTHVASGPIPVSVTEPHVYNVSVKSGTMELRWNGRLVSRATGLTSGFSSAPEFGLSRINTGYVYFFRGSIAEMRIYDTALDESARYLVNQELGTRYGIDAVVAAPTDLTAQVQSPRHVALSWTGTAPRHQIERAESIDGTFATLAWVQESTVYTDTTTQPDQTYVYRVRAVTLSGASAPSASVSVQTGHEASANDHLRLWLRADAGLAVAGSGAVDRWVDQSGRGHDAVMETRTYMPTKIANWIPGRAAVRFDGSDYLSLPATTLAGMTDGEAYVVMQSDIAAAQTGLWTMAPGSHFTHYPWSNGWVYESFGLAGTHLSSGPIPMPVTEPHVYNVSVKSGTMELRWNGRLVSRATGLTSGFSSAPEFGLSRINTGYVYFFRGSIAELRIYDAALDESARYLVNQELGTRYSIDAVVAAPTDLTAQVQSPRHVALSWTGTAPRHQIERAESIDGTFATLAWVQESTVYTDTTTQPDQTYVYRVRAVTLSGASAPSATVSVHTGHEARAHDHLRLWLRADAGLAVAGSGAVDRWDDQSGRGHDAVMETRSYMPTKVANWTPGHPAVYFDGSDYLQLPATTLAGMTEGEAYIVMQSDVAAAQTGLWTVGSGSHYTHYPWSNGWVYESFGLQGTHVASGPIPVPVTAPHVYNVSVKSGTMELRWNGRLVSRATGLTSGFSSAPEFGLSRINNGYVSYFRGSIAELRIYDTALDESARYLVNQELGTRYGIDAVVAAPTDLTAQVQSPRHVALSWTGTAPRHQIERAESIDGTFATLEWVQESTVYTDTTTQPDQTYVYRVRAVTLSGASAPSASVSVQTGHEASANDHLRLWLRADAGLAVAGSGAVDRWIDQSGRGHDAVMETRSYMPTKVANWTPGHPAVYFDGSDFLQLPSTTLAGMTEGEAYIVMQSDVAAAQTGLWTVGSGSHYTHYPWSNGWVYESFGLQGTHVASGPIPVPVTAPHVYNVSVKSGTMELRWNGRLVSRATGLTSGFSSAPELGLSRINTGYVYFFRGSIAELRIYDTALDMTKRIKVETELQQRYLPSEFDRVALTAVSASDSVVLTWPVPTFPVLRYVVDRASSTGVWTPVGYCHASSGQWADREVAPGTYQYRLRLLDSAQVASSLATVTVAPISLASSSLRAEISAAPTTEGMLPITLSGSGSVITRGNAKQWRIATPGASVGADRLRLIGGTGTFLRYDTIQCTGDSHAYVVLDTVDVGGGAIDLYIEQANRSGLGSAVGAGTALECDQVLDFGWRTAQDYAAGSSAIRLIGAGGALRVGVVIRVESERGNSPYRITAIRTHEDGTKTCEISAIQALLAPLSPGADVTVTTGIVTYTWSWQPEPGLHLPWGDQREVIRTFRGTDSQAWATVGGVYRDTVGRPDGIYPVDLEIVDTGGRRAAKEVNISLVTGQAPHADPGTPTVGGAGTTPVAFDASASSDDFGIVDYLWDADVATDSDGDGQSDNDLDIVGCTGWHVYPTAGSYTAKLRVADGRGQTDVATVPVNVVALAAPTVQPVLFEGDAHRPHPAISGVPLRVMAVAQGGRIAYRWNFGDGSTEVSNVTNNPWGIETIHTFVGNPGQAFSVSIAVANMDGLESVATFQVRLYADTPDIRSDLAIRDGLWRLHLDQNRTDTPGLWQGYGGYYPSAVSSALQAFAIHGHLPQGNALRDPYVETVRRGFNRLSQLLQVNAPYQTTYTDISWTSGVVMNDANARAIECTASAPYELGMVMDAYASTQNPLGLAISGPAGVRGRRTIDLVNDMIDVYCWGQDEATGGWRYGWNYSTSDNSVCQWAAVGMIAAEETFGLYADEGFKTRNRRWLAASFTDRGSGGGYFGYDSAQPIMTGGSATAPSGLVQCAWANIPRDHRYYQAVEHYMRVSLLGYYQRTHFSSHADFFYSSFAMLKAMRLARPAPIVLMDGLYDWYGDPNTGLRANLLQSQQPNGAWISYGYVPGLATSWSVIMLSPSLFKQTRTRLDNHDPEVTARDLTIPTDPGQASAQVAVQQIVVRAIDPDGDVVATRMVPSGRLPVGISAVQVIVSDGFGATATGYATVTVEDREPPNLATLPPLVVTTDPGLPDAASASLPHPAASDNVGVSSLTNNAPGRLGLGDSLVTWWARDAVGNTAQTAQRITVVDREAPAIQPPIAAIVRLPDDATDVPVPDLGLPTAHDNVAVVSLTNSAAPRYELGTHVITWTVTDAAGNVGTATQTVIVQREAVLPIAVITSPGEGVTFAAGSSLSCTTTVAYAAVGAVDRVEVLVDGVLIGSDVLEPYQVTLSNMTPGDHIISARVHFLPAWAHRYPAFIEADAHAIHVVPGMGGNP